MERSLQVHKLVPVIIEPDQIGLDIEAALTENDEGVDFAVPNVMFEVRVGVQKVYEGKSDAETGAFVAKNIPIGKVDSSFEVVVFARDKVCGLSVRVQMNVMSLMTEIKNRRECAKEGAQAAAMKKKNMSQEEEWEAFRHSRYEDKSGLSLVHEAEKMRIRKRKLETLMYLCVNGNREYKSELLEYQTHESFERSMLRNALKNSWDFLFNLDFFIEFSCVKDVLKQIASEATSKDAENVFYFIDRYEYQPWAQEVAMAAAAKNPEAAIKYYDKYEDQPWAGEVLTFARRQKK